MTMLITVSSSIQPTPIRHHASPPPTLPKPKKDNLRLQQLLKKAAKKNAMLAAEQAKSFRSNLSPVNEASSDLEHSENVPPAETPKAVAPGSTSLPVHLSIKPITHHRVPSPFRKSKPFVLKVTEQRRIAEHLRLTTPTAESPLHEPGAPKAPQKLEGTDAHLPSAHNTSVLISPHPPLSSTPSKEGTSEATYITKVHTYFRSVKAPRTKTPTSYQTQATSSHEDKRLSSPSPETSGSEPFPGQTSAPLDSSKAPPPTLQPALPPAAKAEIPNQAPRPTSPEETSNDPSPKPSTPDVHSCKVTAHGSEAEIFRSEKAPELHRQDGDMLKPLTPSTTWKPEHPETASPAQAGPTPNDMKVEHTVQPQPTPSLPNTSPPLKAKPTPVEDSRPLGAKGSGWHRLRKHLILQPEAPSFPELEAEKQRQEEGNKEKDSSLSISQDNRPFKSRAMKMWDAILYQMTVNKERKQQAEEKKAQKEEGFFLPRRLPIFLYKPRFDARKLRELAAKPMSKITTVFEVGRYGSRTDKEHAKSFNRTASGWSVN
ncbi:pollen-specific leucine-rich repeat extensin-like protein 1 isoform X2 [Lagopus leucura]|nr:pollen-specific leucine-rich repeat extensin-like protein 1 isoform X2 [Lagopus leucura]